MLVKDEDDIIEHTLNHLKEQVDHVIVADNGSTDHTLGILNRLAKEDEAWLDYRHDPEVGYYQSAKTTALAREALERGFRWVLPCDADEYWYAPDGRPIRDWLDGLAPDVQIVRAAMFNHIPTVLDPTTGTPFQRIGWRKREPQELKFGKVCCRTRPDLRIDMGNHSAQTGGTALEIPGLAVRHYSWRSPEQYVRKIRNGARAYAATDMPPGTGLHWRMFGMPDHPDFTAQVAAHYHEWFCSRDPDADDSLVYDPVE